MYSEPKIVERLNKYTVVAIYNGRVMVVDLFKMNQTKKWEVIASFCKEDIEKLLKVANEYDC